MRGGRAIAEVLAQVQVSDDERTAAVRKTFEAIAKNRGLGTSFRTVRRGGSDEDLIMNCLYSDLVIIGQRQLQKLPGYGSPERLFLISGAPVLVLPDAWKSDTGRTKILIGWNASREARRAVADAMPFLVTAQSVKVLVVDAEDRVIRHGEEPGADIALYLARHGARVEVSQASSQGSSIADVVLSYAADHNINLIVMGAYSRARSAQIVFGGVTRNLLKQTPVPILMSR